MGSGAATVVDATRVGPLARLEPLARAIFGDGDRASGWFQRKLFRECVDPGLSCVATTRPECPTDSRHWVGYVLTGRAPVPQDQVPRTCGIGVIADQRGHGVGARLVETVLARVRDAGYPALEVPSQAGPAKFFAKFGLLKRRKLADLLHFGLGTAQSRTEPSARPELWRELRSSEHSVSAWLAHAWNRTPYFSRRTVQLASEHGPTTLYLAKEGIAWGLHRLITPRNMPSQLLVQTLESWRRDVPAPSPLVMIGTDPDHEHTHALLAAGWNEVRSSWLLRAELSARQ